MSKESDDITRPLPDGSRPRRAIEGDQPIEKDASNTDVMGKGSLPFEDRDGQERLGYTENDGPHKGGTPFETQDGQERFGYTSSDGEQKGGGPDGRLLDDQHDATPRLGAIKDLSTNNAVAGAEAGHVAESFVIEGRPDASSEITDAGGAARPTTGADGYMKIEDIQGESVKNRGDAFTARESFKADGNDFAESDADGAMPESGSVARPVPDGYLKVDDIEGESVRNRGDSFEFDDIAGLPSASQAPGVGGDDLDETFGAAPTTGHKAIIDDVDGDPGDSKVKYGDITLKADVQTTSPDSGLVESGDAALSAWEGDDPMVSALPEPAELDDGLDAVVDAGLLDDGVDDAGI